MVFDFALKLYKRCIYLFTFSGQHSVPSADQIREPWMDQNSEDLKTHCHFFLHNQNESPFYLVALTKKPVLVLKSFQN